MGCGEPCRSQHSADVITADVISADVTRTASGVHKEPLAYTHGLCSTVYVELLAYTQTPKYTHTDTVSGVHIELLPQS